MPRHAKEADFLLPESVRNWFHHLYTHILGGHEKEMERLYDHEFNVLTLNYFKNASWPEPSAIAGLVHQDPVFMLLYTQVYHRHIYSRLNPDWNTRKASWDNYCALFDAIIEGKTQDGGAWDVDTLPSAWIYDLVGEFVYQYQTHCQLCARFVAKPKLEREDVMTHSNHMNESSSSSSCVWSSTRVLTYLNALIEHGRRHSTTNAFMAELGSFSTIALARLYVLYGDYYTALKVLAPIDWNAKETDAVYAKAPACHVGVLYHMGFSQLMLCRFSEAIQSLSAVVLQVARNQNFYARLSQYDQLLKLNDKSLGLLAIALALCPGHRVDEQVDAMVRDKYADKLAKMQKTNALLSSVVSDVFSYACPKFILPEAGVEENRSKEASKLQLKAFLQTMQRFRPVPTLRSYLKLYQSIDLLKLARFRQETPESVRSQLMLYKRMNHVLCQDVPDMHFFLNNDLVQMDLQKLKTRSGEFFMNQIHKFVPIIRATTTKAI